jgi:olfactory receptor
MRWFPTFSSAASVHIFCFLFLHIYQQHENFKSINCFRIYSFVIHRWSRTAILNFHPLPLFMHLLTILGNLLIILAASSDFHLQTLVYFVLSSISYNDIFLITCRIPKMLVNIQTQNQSITYTVFLSQVCFLFLSVGMENCLLAEMAYDFYVAICHPLRSWSSWNHASVSSW